MNPIHPKWQELFVLDLLSLVWMGSLFLRYFYIKQKELIRVGAQEAWYGYILFIEKFRRDSRNCDARPFIEERIPQVYVQGKSGGSFRGRVIRRSRVTGRLMSDQHDVPYSALPEHLQKSYREWHETYARAR
ncbi:hypothetical protein KW785_00920 [Candidatus Parcubacteria bacterium]|nr:hypothetical protein [Candidatus Parcubacteria bacterium]